MNHSEHPIIRLMQADDRYQLEAYQLVRDALAYAQDVLELGSATQESETNERHLTGQELCHALRLLAIEQFGFMAHTVLKSWGIRSTSDIGEIVYNMIEVGLMRKSANDRREHFDNVFDFEEAFERDFEISVPKTV